MTTIQRRRWRSAVSMALVGAGIASTLTLGAPAAALADQSEIGSQTEFETRAVATTVEAVAPPVEIIRPVETRSGNLVSDVGRGKVVIPDDPAAKVKLSATGGPSISIGMPDKKDSENAEVAPDGTVVYRDAEGVLDIAVQAVSSGVRIQTIINGKDSPTEFRYPVTLPKGGSLSLLHDGTAAVLDAENRLIAKIETPWARDAQNNPVPTHYDVQGSTLVQTVEHTSGQFAYPVVADPFVWQWWGISLYLDRNQTNNVMFGMAAAAVASLWIPDPTITKIAAAALGLASAYANWAYNRGACLAVGVTWWGSWVIYHYYGGSCR